ncbi:transcriptional regulator, LysR family [Roseovarius azorensis]|uniref:Transcriptional regulator, LysR family n=1 Tax=Roseovarius azorensis TaxID=1287727 RepID=A0A1H7KIC5_9RHOB|nr:LysR family transcriptional regulator [Roseovarius azorensis]SEK86611.1 transcriptional regulator, LysR family [Roseovarius azorensis]
MARSLPPVKWFRAFEVAARHLSFTRAADEIGLTQSAVSQQIKSLETRLGAALFLRSPSGLALTDAGRKLLPQVGAALELLQASTLAFDAAPDEAMLTIATSVSVAQWVIAPRLPEFQALHPDLRLRLVSAIWPDDFISAVADVEIRFGSERQVGLHALPLRPSDLIALKSPALSGSLQTLPLIEAVGTSVGWDAFGAAHGLTGLQPVLFVDSYGMALNLAANGAGVALVSALLGRDAVERSLLIPAHPGSIAAREGYYIAIREQVPAARQFSDWLNRHLARQR